MRKARIMLVDDDDEIQSTYGIMLENCGYEVVPASNAYEAVSPSRQESIDLVILDFNLSNNPLAQGLSVLTHLWEDPNFLAPVILHTGFGDSPLFKAQVERIEESFPDRCVAASVVKSSDPSRLLNAVSSVLEKIDEGLAGVSVPQATLEVYERPSSYSAARKEFEETIDEFFSISEERVDESLDLLRNFEDDNRKAAWNQIYRHIHTIKGEAALIGFEAVQTFCHSLENLLSLTRNANSSNGERRDLVEKCLGTLSDLLYVSSGKETDFSGEAISFEELQGRAVRLTEALHNASRGRN